MARRRLTEYSNGDTNTVERSRLNAEKGRGVRGTRMDKEQIGVKYKTFGEGTQSTNKTESSEIMTKGYKPEARAARRGHQLTASHRTLPAQNGLQTGCNLPKSLRRTWLGGDVCRAAVDDRA